MKPVDLPSGGAAFTASIDCARWQADAPLSVLRDAKSGLIVIEAPGIRVSTAPARTMLHVDRSRITVVTGAPRCGDARAPTPIPKIAAQLAQGIAPDASWLAGRYALLHVDVERGSIVVATDRFATCSLCYAIDGAHFAASDRADTVPSAALREIDVQALYDYFYFHVIPAPRTAYRGVARLESALMLRFDGRMITRQPTWIPRFSPNAAIATPQRFRAAIEATVRREADDGHVGAFLSGGTDSSTIAGMLCLATGGAAKTFSIGFDAEGYDEMAYARIAARHFGTEHHEYYVTPADLVTGMPAVAHHFDQPFGNSSTVPAWYCARLAREHGLDKLLAGDGGDELFGGNKRYAVQKVFDIYGMVPSALRTGLIEPVLSTALAGRLPLVRKAARYVEQARAPMPERGENYNLLRRIGPERLLTEAFLERIDAQSPIEFQRKVYLAVDATTLVDRMLAYDWRFTLADTDLPKVVAATSLAGLRVAFPLLDDALVDLSLALDPSDKVRGLKLRYFFKEALRGFLPDDILRKKKHGFGLPFGLWIVRDANLAKFARASVERLVERNVLRPEMPGELFGRRLAEHAAFYGEMIWIATMLEQWISSHEPRLRID